MRLLAAVALTSFATFADEPPTAPANGIDAASVAAFFDAAFAVERNEHELAGAVIAVVKDGQTIFKKGYGYADLEKRVPADPDQSLFRIASISKTFTWTAVMQLVEEGKLDLDADIRTYLDFEIPDNFPEPIRMRDLMTHSPGFEELGIGGAARTAEGLTPLGEYLAKHMPARVRPPGQFSSYSNYGSAVAGYIVQRISGMPWEDYLEQRIFQPLGMQHTSLRQPLPDSLAAHRAIGYKFNDGKFAPQPFLMAQQAPAGVISTTAADMASYMLAHLELGRLGEARILSEDTARRMQTELFRHDPDVNPFLHGFYRTDRNGVVIFGHGGDMNQFHSDMALYPELGLGVFMSFNSDPGADARGAVLVGFVDRFFPRDLPADLPADKTAITLDSLDEYSGEWASMRRNHSTLERLTLLVGTLRISATDDGQLRMSTAQRTTRWVPTAKDRFRALYNDNRLIFHRDQQGRVATAFMSTNPVAGFEKVSAIESPTLHQRLFAAVGLIALITVLGYAYRAIRRAPVDKRLPATSVWLGWLLGLMVLVQLTGLVYGLTTDTDEFNYGLPPLIVALLWQAKVTAILAVLAAVFAALALVQRRGSVGARTRYGVLGASGLVFAWQLWFWNLL